jgi:hypothetical protein
MKTITQPLLTYIDDVLGDNHYRSISPVAAEILSHITKGDLTVHIQYKDRNGLPLVRPILWRYSAWKADTESWLHAAAISQRNREERFVFDDNVNRLAKTLASMGNIPEDLARLLAYRKIKKNQTKLITEVLHVRLAKTINDL